MFAVRLTADAELRPLNPWHAEEFLANLDRARKNMTPWVSPAFVATDIDGARLVLQRYADRWARDDGGIWGIWSDGTLVGGVLLVSLNAGTGVCEAGCWLEPGAEGRGLVTRAVSRLIDWAVDERGLHRVEWRVLSGNVRSIAVARRLGMRRDGVLREVAAGPDGRSDLEIWSLLAPEWRAHRAGAPRGTDGGERLEQ